MQHALALARKGAGLASPNPMGGCVIVREGQIVGEGFHQYEWRDHAEIAALKSAGEKARGAHRRHRSQTFPFLRAKNLR
jgi:diaminohydroxyphosphoribosylaminopyrimidine deaminase/5-amino-6-(5-phosphoribosylamino)uracil reductase